LQTPCFIDLIIRFKLEKLQLHSFYDYIIQEIKTNKKLR